MNENGAIVQRWFEEVWNQHRNETIDELMNDDSVCYSDQGPMRGAHGFRQQQYEPLRLAFPDLRVSVDEMLCQDDNVVVRWSAHGTHSGPGLPVAPTNNAVNFSGISWIRVRDGKLREGWQASNVADVLRSLADAAAHV